MTNYLRNYKQYFSLQDSQPYCLTNDFSNNNWTPRGTYWTPQPDMKIRSVPTFSDNVILNKDGIYKIQTLNYDNNVYDYNIYNKNQK